MHVFLSQKRKGRKRVHVQMTNARPQSYAARATLLAKERKGILQAKFWEARAMACVEGRGIRLLGPLANFKRCMLLTVDC